ncbi:IS66 family insertion sequence element accessory protein TnpB [Escherichia coli]|nr:IS66 family insertion sequence element accessory protein TnpB [Escherichia coli]UUN65292.1 IS66 family insertion sequence element accessory protein TnpB [Escherichia coli]
MTHVFIFRGRSGSQVKLLWSTGDGLCLLTKRLERGRFAWPSARDGKVFLTQAQLAMLLEGIDWRQPKRLLTSLTAYSALFDHGLASKFDQRFASIRSTGNLTFSTAF